MSVPIRECGDDYTKSAEYTMESGDVRVGALRSSVGAEISEVEVIWFRESRNRPNLSLTPNIFLHHACSLLAVLIATGPICRITGLQ